MKKFLQKIFPGLFVKIIDSKSEPKSELKVTVINFDADERELHTSLGISEKRFEEIIDLVESVYDKTESMDFAIEHVSSKMVHANELAFASIAVYRYHEWVCSQHEQQKKNYVGNY